MKAVFLIAFLLVKADPWAMARGAALSIVVLVMGAALLGLSGWFITATGLAGIAGAGDCLRCVPPLGRSAVLGAWTGGRALRSAAFDP